MLVLTSVTHPLRVDFLPEGAAPWAPRVGLTIAPGKHASRLEGGLWERDMEADLARLRDVYKTSLLVSLCEVREMAAMRMSDLWDRCRAMGIEVLPFAIVDVSVPPSTAAAAPVVRAIVAAAEAGRTVVIHCRGGLGRTGTIAACALATAGHTGREAISLVRSARKGAIETRAQERFVDQFAADWVAGKLAAAPPPPPPGTTP